ncbi:MAG: ATP-binding protein [Deltaproteobacteria bacterium]|nr:ATP-binding protein [Deltaproteobacteria bacterium]
MRRAYESLLRAYLGMFPCVGIVGVRQCGKTTLLDALPEGFRRFDLERARDVDLVSRDPDLFLRLHPDKVAIDEAQVLPSLFPALRVAIDARRDVTGRFVVTGSSSPGLVRSLSESLAGRIGLIEMAPLAWAEVQPRGREPGLVALLVERSTRAHDLAGLLRPRGTIGEVHDFWLRGGYPEPWLRREPKFRAAWMESYVATYLLRDVGRLFPGLDQHRFRAFLGLLAGLSGSVVNYAEVGRMLGVSQPTARDYFTIAHGTFLWRQLPAFVRNPLRRIVKHPRGYLRDSGLLHRLLRIPDLDALLAHPQMGRSWEGMVVEELVRALGSLGIGHDCWYYRSSGGAEVDLVLEGDFGLVAFEIKHSGGTGAGARRALRDFVREQRCRMGIVIDNAERPQLLEQDIVSVPFACL